MRHRKDPEGGDLTEVIMAIGDPELMFSPLCGCVTYDGITLDVKIYRFASPDEPWQLEVIDHEGGSTTWDELFATDQDAYLAFDQAVEADGIRSFVEAPTSLH